MLDRWIRDLFLIIFLHVIRQRSFSGFCFNRKSDRPMKAVGLEDKACDKHLKWPNIFNLIRSLQWKIEDLEAENARLVKELEQQGKDWVAKCDALRDERQRRIQAEKQVYAAKKYIRAKDAHFHGNPSATQTELVVALKDALAELRATLTEPEKGAGKPDGPS